MTLRFLQGNLPKEGKGSPFPRGYFYHKKKSQIIDGRDPWTRCEGEATRQIK